MATLTKTLLPRSGYTNQYYTYQCVVTENSYNVANNESNVTVTFSIKGPWAPSFYEWATNYGIIIDGTTVKTGSSSPYISTSYVQLLTWTGNIKHNSDGSKSIKVGVYLYHSGPSNYLPTQYSSSSPLTMGSVALTTIPRKSSISFGEFTMGSKGDITINSASTSFQHTITYVFGSISGTIVTKTTNTSVSWTPKVEDLAGQIRTSTRGQGTLTITTYSGSTSIGSNSYTFYCNLPENVVPTLGTITLTPQTYDLLIQNKNKVKISVSGCSGGTGSDIKSYTFSGPGISSTTTATEATSSIISSSGTKTYTVTVTDGRGRSSSGTATIKCYAWSAPSIILDAYRVTSSTSTTENDSGEYVRCEYSLSYSSVSSTNDVTVKIYYKKNTDSTWSSVTALTNGTSTSGNKTIGSIALDSTYTIYATIADNYSGNSESNRVTVFSAERILNIRKNGSGIALGKMAESNNLLDVKWPIKTGDPAKTMRNLTYKSANYVPTDENGDSDTVGAWCAEGNLATVYYNTDDSITDQPSQYGFVLNITNGPTSSATNTHQLWATQGGGNLAHRGGNSNGWVHSWRTILDSYNYTNYVSQKPTSLYSSTSGTIGTITLSSSAANFTYLEIFYADNYTRQSNSVRVYSPNGKYVSLSCVEPSTNNSEPRLYIKVSGWTISGTSMTVGRSDLSGANGGVFCELYKNAGGNYVDVDVTQNNYIKIFRILGYK